MGGIVHVEQVAPAYIHIHARITFQPAAVFHVVWVVVPLPGADQRIVVQDLERIEQIPLLGVGKVLLPPPVKVQIEPFFVYQVLFRVNYLPRPHEAGVGYALLSGVKLAHAHHHVDPVVREYIKGKAPPLRWGW